jgi:hypothetical protein
LGVFLFPGVDVLTVNGEQQLVLNVEERRREERGEERNSITINCMGSIYQQIYSKKCCGISDKQRSSYKGLSSGAASAHQFMPMLVVHKRVN